MTDIPLRDQLARIIAEAALLHEGPAPWHASADALLADFDIQLRSPQPTEEP